MGGAGRVGRTNPRNTESKALTWSSPGSQHYQYLGIMFLLPPFLPSSFYPVNPYMTGIKPGRPVKSCGRFSTSRQSCYIVLYYIGVSIIPLSVFSPGGFWFVVQFFEILKNAVVIYITHVSVCTYPVIS